MVDKEKKETTACCAACGIGLDGQGDEAIVQDGLQFCLWCWSNDCCRITRDAAAAATGKRDA